MPKMGIIVPYRDREEHLKAFTSHMQNFLKLPFHIFVIEQAPGRPFNRGKLLNIGYTFAHKSCDYLCFHDVDMLPVKADYNAPSCPTHLATSVEQFDYGMPYPSYFGGVTLINCAQFAQVNGYSNEYWGWGKEDDDFRLRCERTGLTIQSREGVFLSLPHEKAQEDDPLLQPNRERYEEFYFGHFKMQEEGLKTLAFEKSNEILKETFSLISVIV